MKIAFFSESQIIGKVQRTFVNARTEYAWMMALDAPHYTINNITASELDFDLGIIIVPKNNPGIDLSIYKHICKKVAVMQEGPHWYFQDYSIDKQFNYYNTLMDADWVYCHNKSDVKYYKGLGCKDVRVMRSLMITDGLIPRNEWGDATIIGGNFVSWYGGFDSYIIAREIGDPITAPSMGRKQDREDEIDDIHYMPYYNWREWINVLSQFNIGVHLMRTHAAGTFAMNCAFHGIPCIGYEGLDTQETLHQHLSVKVGDLDMAKQLAKQLKSDDGFYQMCSNSSQEMFKKFYTEEAWKENWEKQWTK
jgi:hypothetical protein